MDSKPKDRLILFGEERRAYRGMSGIVAASAVLGQFGCFGTNGFESKKYFFRVVIFPVFSALLQVGEIGGRPSSNGATVSLPELSITMGGLQFILIQDSRYLPKKQSRWQMLPSCQRLFF